MSRTIYLIISFVSLLSADDECTIGVASGRATRDGRPMIWKTRDYSTERNNEVIFNSDFPIQFLEVVTAGSSLASMGLNQAGFAILNSLANDLPTSSGGYSNLRLMRDALGNCASIEEFEDFVNNNAHGLTNGNFAVLDARGEAAMFEISGSVCWKFDANDTSQAESGYILRTNFALNGSQDGGSGYERFQRTSKLIFDFYSGDSLDYRSILRYQMRDFSDFESESVPVPFSSQWHPESPFGYIYTDVSINRWSSVSATVIQGVLEGESELLSTMWAILGSPAAAITVPYWPVGSTPALANDSITAPLCDIALDIRAKLFDYQYNDKYIDSYKLNDGNGGGLWPMLFAAEDSVFLGAEKWLTHWRTHGLNVPEMLDVEQEYAQYVYDNLQSAYEDLVVNLSDAPVSIHDEYKLNQNYPNPFNSSTIISFHLPVAGQVSISVFNLLGQDVALVFSGQKSSGEHRITLNMSEYQALAGGMYFVRIKVKAAEQVWSELIKIIYIK